MSESPYGLIWRHGTRPFGTLGSPRQHPTLGTVNEARVVDDDGRDLGAGRDRRAAAAQPDGHARLLGDARARPQATVVDGWLHTGDLVTANADGTYTFVSRAQGGAATARPEPLTGRGRGRDRSASRRARGRRRRGALGADRGRGQGLRRGGARPRPRLRPAAGLDRRTALRLQGAPVLAGCGRPPAHADVPGRQAPAPGGSPSPTSTTHSPTFTNPRPRTRDDQLPDLDRHLRRVVHPPARTTTSPRT